MHGFHSRDSQSAQVDPSPERPRRLGRRGRSAVVGITMLLAATGAVAVTRYASAADNPYQRGPDPTVSSVAATSGPFATAQVSVPSGNGFNGGTIYYPTDTSHGTWGGVAIVPGYTAKFANEEAWMGPRLASFGFVVIGIETNNTNDWDTARGTQLLAALDYLTQKSSVRDRVDAKRLAVIGHSMGGGGALSAATQRSSLKAAIGMAPFFPSGSLANDKVPTLIQGGQNDSTVTPSYLDGLYPGLPSTTPGAFVQLAGADHLFWTKQNNVELRTQIPWLKIFVDNDTRYTQLICPKVQDATGVAKSSAKCSLIPTGGQGGSATASPSQAGSPSRSGSATPSGQPSTQPSGQVPASPSDQPPTSPSAPPSGVAGCTATLSPGDRWNDRYNLNVAVSGSSNWTVTLQMQGSARVSNIWNTSATWPSASVMVAKPNGSGNNFGLTIMTNGTWNWPTVSCQPS